MSKQPFLAMIIPMGAAPGYPDQGLPGGVGGGERPDHGFNPAYPDQGLPGGGHYPDQGLPGRPGRPDHPSQGPVRPGRPIDPGFGWGGGEHPSQRPPHPGRPVDPDWGVEGGGDEAPDQGLPGGRPGRPERPGRPWVPPGPGVPVPPDVIATPPDPPAEYADDLIVQVYRPGKGWSTTAYEVPTPAPEPNG